MQKAIIGKKIGMTQIFDEKVPERIDERRRDVPEAEDWAGLEEDLYMDGDNL